MSDEMRIGLIGCGRHGLGNLAPALDSVPDARIVACADDDEMAARDGQETLGLNRPYLDYREMLNTEDLDAVIVAVPHFLLKDISVAVLESGKHLFVEKPMALNPVDGEIMAKTARESGVSLMVGFCQRYSEGRLRMKSLIDSGVIGEITAVTAAKGNPPLTGWLADPIKGGGELHWLGVHITDQVIWITGSHPERVYGEIRWHPTTSADETTIFTMRMQSGVIASITCSQNVSGRLDYVSVEGTAGRIRSDWPSEVVEVVSEILPEYKHPTTIRPIEPLYSSMYQHEMNDWVSGLRNGNPPKITSSDGITVLKVIDAVFESNQSGIPIDIS